MNPFECTRGQNRFRMRQAHRNRKSSAVRDHNLIVATRSP